MSETPPSTSVMPAKGTLGRNIAVLMGSQLSTWVLAIVAAVAIPRFLGAELVGRLHLATSIWALGGVVIGFGMKLVVTRGVARDHSKVGSLLGACIGGRLALVGPVAIAVFGYALVVGYSNQVLVLLAILGIGVVASTTSDGVTAALSGLDRMGSMSIANVLGRVSFVVGAVGFLAFGFGVYSVAAMASAAFFVTLITQVILFRRIWPDLPDPDPLSISSSNVRAMYRASLPFFWISLAVVVYQQVDVIIISMVVEDAEVIGWYSVYERLAGTFLFVPTVFMTAVFPTISRLYGDPETDTEAGGLSSRIIQKAFTSMLLVSIPLGFGAAAVSRPLVVLLFGEGFAGAAPIVFVGGFVLSLTYQTTILGGFLVAMDKQRQWTRFIVLGAVLTVPLDLILVPIFDAEMDNGAVGAVLGFLITESIVLAGAVYLLPRGSLGRSSAFFAVRTILAGGVMFVAVRLVLDTGLLVAILVGALTYGVMIVLLRLVTPEDRQMLLRQLGRGTQPDS